MKTFTLSILAIAFIPMVLLGQRTAQPHPTQVNTLPTASKSQALNSRLIAIKTDDWVSSNWQNEDTLIFTYSGTRGGNYFTTYGTDYDSHTAYDWDGTAWEPVSLFEKTWDSENRMTSITYKYWDGTAWLSDSKETYTYNASGHTVELIVENWNGSAWVGSIRYSYTVDANGNVLTEEHLAWDGTTWQPDNRYTRTYTSSNQLETEISERYVGGSYELQNRISYVYNSNGDVLRVTNERDLGGTWTNDQRTVNTYNASNQLLTTTEEEYLASNWEPLNRHTNTYNAQSFLIGELQEEYVGGMYENVYKFDITPDASGRPTESIFYEWNGGVWTEENRTTRGYDAAGNENEYGYYIWDAGAWYPLRNTYSTFNQYNQLVSDTSYGNNMTLDYREYYYYEEYEDGTGITSLPTLSSAVLPNPFAINVAIQLNVTEAGNHTFEVYNMAGQRIHTEGRYLAPGQQTIVWDAADAPKGVYFYKVNSAAGVASGKLVKQ